MTTDETRIALDWEQRFADDTTPWERPGLHPAFVDWQVSGAFDGLGTVIVPGCGRAPEVAAFADSGVATTAADLSTTAINWQRKRLEECELTATLFEGDVLAWRPDAPVDAVYEQTFLCAIPPRLRTEYEAAVHDWLRPGGRLFALFMQKDERGGPPYGCDIEAMRTLFPADRWDWPAEAPVRYPHPSLNGKPELAVVLTRR